MSARPLRPSSLSTSSTPAPTLTSLSPSQLTRLKESFSILDRDGDGLITPSDLSSMLSSLSLSLPVSSFIPPDQPGINLASFLTTMSVLFGSLSQEQELLEAFEAFDEDDCGAVDMGELRQALVGMGERMSGPEIEQALQGFRRRRGPKGVGRKAKGGEVFEYRRFVEAVGGEERDEGDGV